ncbi:MAG: hypothetical protein E7319_02915 [Clostridiales bacterium]|nr:hypothetical protein [Clostridiales bacterium]
MKDGAKRQTILLTGLNGLIRALGFLLRVMMSRILGAEVMGIAELAQSVHMLAITPLTSGLPLAISRLTAKEQKENKVFPLMAGMSLVRQLSLVLIPPFLILSPALARLSGDVRVLPSLWFTAPCMLILGYSGAYNGYCYGTRRSYLPAVSELTEQTLRMGFTLLLLPVLGRLSVAWLAAVPVAATMVAEVIGLGLVVLVLRLPTIRGSSINKWKKPIVRLAAPATATRLIHTLLRSATAIIIPMRLVASGLPASEATARLGMLNGMVFPLMMLPCIFTGALSMVMIPRLAQSEENARSCKEMLLKLFAAGLLVSLVCMGCLILLAPFIAVKIYRLAELQALLLAASPLCFLCAAENLTGGAIAALGLQKYSMYGSIPSSLLALLLTWMLTSRPELRLLGVILSQCIGHGFGIAWNGGVIVRWWRSHQANSPL